MKNLPVLLNTDKKSCLIVGGGKVGTRRAKLMSQTSLKIDLISKKSSGSITKIIAMSGGTSYERSWRPDDIKDNYIFIVAATDDHGVNREISVRARELRIPVNVASDSSLSDIAFPSIIDRDPITIAVSSGTASPILARSLADRIDSLIPSGYGRLAQLVGKYRQLVNETIADPCRKKSFWQRILGGHVAESIFSGNPDTAENLFLESLKNAPQDAGTGEVYLIGAGPGDPDLLTFKAYRLLQQSEIILYDRLV